MIKFRWKYVWPYLLVIGTISVLVYVNSHIIQVAINSNNHFAHTINTAGRQRALSAKLVNSLLIWDRTGQKPADYDRNLALWNTVHNTLQRENSNKILKGESNSISDQFAELAPIQSQLNAKLSGINNRSELAERIAPALELEALYQPDMDKIVTSMEQEAVLTFAHIRDRQQITAGISGLILILEILLLIIPYHRRLLVAYRQVKVHKGEIEEQKEEIRQQNMNLSHQNLELEQLHRTQELTLNGINAGVWNWDLQTGKEEWSLKMYNLLGYMPGEIPAGFSTFINMLLHTDDREKMQRAIDAHLQRNKPYHLNVRILRKDGQYNWYETSGQAARDTQGKPIQMAGSIIDINDKVTYRQELENMNATKDKLFAIIAHDLRSPIAAIKSFVELQSEGIISQEEFFEYVDKIKESITFLSETLDNLLQWALSQMQGFNRTETVVNLNETIGHICDFYKATAEQKNIALRVDIHDNHFIVADRNHIFLAIRNIISNCIKFTPQGGHIHISIDGSNNQERIIISDTGIGMTEEEINNIRAKKYVSQRGTNGEKGSGLGLPLSFDVIQENNGQLTINSTPGIGSTFIISFDKTTAPEVISKPASQQNPING